MSVPEVPYDIYSLEEAFQASLRRVGISLDELRYNFTKSIEELRSNLNKGNKKMIAQLHERNQAMLKNPKLQMKPQAVPVSDLSLSKVTSHKIFISSDLAPDLDPVQGIAQVFSKPSNIDPHTSRLQT